VCIAASLFLTVNIGWMPFKVLANAACAWRATGQIVSLVRG